jgi:hypothetical protein
MKKALLFIAIVLLVVAAGDGLFGVVLKGVYSCTSARFARLYTYRLDASVIVLGNSRAVNGFFTPQLTQASVRLKWMNLGYNGVGPILVEALLDDYLERYPKPRLVVFEVSNLLQRSGAIRDLRLFAPLSPRLAAIDREVSGFSGWLASYSHAFAANGEMVLRCLYYVSHDDQMWVNEGQISRETMDVAMREHGLSLRASVSPESFEAYARMFRRLKELGIPCCCVVTPYLLSGDDRVVLQTWLDRIRELGASEVHCINLSDSIVDPSFYADPAHLNRKGAEAFSEVLLRAMLRERIIE